MKKIIERMKSMPQYLHWLFRGIICFAICYIDANHIHTSYWNDLNMGTIGWISLLFLIISFVLFIVNALRSR